MSAVRNTPGTSITKTFRPYVTSISAEMITDSVAAVGEVMSDFFNPAFFLSVCDSTAFYFLYHLCFKKISTRSAQCFWILLSSSPFIGWNTTLPCDRVQDSHKEQKFWITRLDWVGTQLNQFEIFGEHENCQSRWKQWCSRWKQCWMKTMYK